MEILVAILCAMVITPHFPITGFRNKITTCRQKNINILLRKTLSPKGYYEKNAILSDLNINEP